MDSQTLISLRIPEPLAEQTRISAQFMGLSRSEYARQAIEEMNHKVMQQRIAALSAKLANHSAAESDSMEDVTGDALNG